MSRLYNISWSVNSYLMIFVFIGPVLYTLTALGLFKRVPLAGFLMCFIFIGPGVAEFTHFIFPLLKPDVQPTVAASVQASSAGPTHAELAQFLVSHDRALLLSRNVHSNSAHDPRRVRPFQLSSRSA